MTTFRPSDDVPQMLTLGINASDRGDYNAALQVFKRVYQMVPPDKAPNGLSSYGLCLAKVERRTKTAADLCQKAIDLEFYEGRHWANLVRVYIAGNSRRKAVEVLETGLRKMRKDQALLRVREEIGYRRTPYLRFLGRQNPINKLYSRTVGKLTGKGQTVVIAIAGAIYASFLVALFLWILK